MPKKLTAPNGTSGNSENPAAPAMPNFAKGIDIETLLFFLKLHDSGSLPRAAEQMGVSLSSANRMLAKLREYWNSPLFVRSGFSMQPTLEAKHKYGKIREILHVLEELQRDGTINPTTLKRTVRIACYDNAFACALAANLAAFAERLPQVVLQVTQADENLFENLVNDRLDLIIFARQGIPSGVYSMPLFTTPYSCVVRKGHPLAKLPNIDRGLTKHELAPYKQVLVNAQPDRYRRPNGPGNGYFNPSTPDKVALITPFFLSVPLCLSKTDFYAIVPMLTAKLAFSGLPVEALPITEAAPKLTTQLGWHERTQNDPGFQCVRANLIDLIQKKNREVLGC